MSVPPNSAPPAKPAWKLALGPVKKVARRALRPILLRLQYLDARLDDSQREMQNLHARIDDVADRIEGTVALAWDYSATVRRLGVLEDRVEALLAQNELNGANEEQISSPGSSAQAA